MDRPNRSKIGYHSPMSVIESFSIDILLHADRRDAVEFEVDELSRQAVHADTILWDSEDDRSVASRRILRQSQTGVEANEKDGDTSYLSEAEPVERRSGAQNIPVFTASFGDCSTESGLVNGYYIYSTSPWFSLSYRGYRLVQPLRVILGIIQFPRYQFLSVGIGSSTQKRHTRDIQYRPRFSIYKRGIYRKISGEGNSNQYGWSRSSTGQYLRRTFMENIQIRRSVFTRLFFRRRGIRKFRSLFQVLQYRAHTSVSRVQNARRSPFRNAMKKSIDFSMSRQKMDRHRSPVRVYFNRRHTIGSLDFNRFRSFLSELFTNNSRTSSTLIYPDICPMIGVHLIR